MQYGGNFVASATQTKLIGLEEEGMKDPCRYCNKSYVGCKRVCMTLALAYKTNPGHKLAVFLDEKAKEADVSLAEFAQRVAERKEKEKKSFTEKRQIILAKAKQKKEYYAKNREKILARQKDYVKRERELLERLKAERKEKEGDNTGVKGTSKGRKKQVSRKKDNG